ncbi:MAG: GNAT family N-acetyltransferase [Anaerolineae bacterium]|nr:GNAT family N-acetyltransferase [Anaerolineae bacterium]
MTTTDIQLRLATNADAGAIMALISAVFAEYGMIWDAAVEVPDLFDIETNYSSARGAFFVSEIGGQIVGTVGVTFEGASHAEVHRLYVSPTHRRLGLGRLLMNHVLMWARERDLSEMTAWSDTRFDKAHNLYRSLGFTQMEGERPMVGDVNNSAEYQFVLTLASM